MSRPYSANYAIGFIFVIGVMMFFQGMCVLAYPDVFRMNGIPEDVIDTVAGLSIAMLVLPVLLFLGIPMAHKASLMVLCLSLFVEWMATNWETLDQVDVLTISLILLSMGLLLTKPCREYYSGWGPEIQSEWRWPRTTDS
ncbi:MAG: hypothetical protein IKR86_06640 [Candidatus Methanomethylophilaceae archaeon]|nr:hypothetical protein [Candidatus Methanomethylophilaceae archaeon]